MELSDEEKKDYSTRLLREWWITTIQSLVENIGSQEALVHLKPYHINSGRAGAINIKKLTGLPTENAGELLALWIGIVNPRVDEGRVRVRASSKDLAFAQLSNCATKGVSRETCYCYCVFACSGGIELNQDFETELVKSIPGGDENCCFRTIRIGADPSLKPTMEIRIPEISPELAKFLELAYTGEFWTDATRAYLDALGSDETIKLLKAEMKKSGNAIGKKLTEKIGPEENSIGNIVHLLNELHQKKESCRFDKEVWSAEVTECPFASSGPSIMCLQYEAFFNGICDAIDPSYEFAYDRMMTKGEKTCHWMIKKKGELAKEKSKEETPSDDPIKILTMMYVKGEITKEEYEEKMAVIKKHYPR
jgi:hypothetical protein